MPLEALPAEERETLRRLTRSLDGVRGEDRIKWPNIDVHCTRPPLKCTIIIGFQMATAIDMKQRAQ